MNLKARLNSILSGSALPEWRFMSDPDEIKDLVAQLRQMGKKIIQTSGVFDFLHSGHARYLEKAREYGDILIVGVNTDEWAFERKGKYPVRNLLERVELLAHLRSVDLLTLQDGTLHRLVLPDVLVASETTHDLGLRRADMEAHCGRLVMLPAQSDLHSGQLIARMK